MRLADRLEAAGLAGRTSPGPGRTLALQLTESGWAAALRVLARRQAAVEQLVRRLEPDEAAALDRLAGRLLAAMTTDRASAQRLCRLCDEPLCAAGPGCPVDHAAESVQHLAPTLLAVPGCGVLGAATIIGETAGARRFSSRAAFARFTGTAPVPVWSGDTRGKVRLNRGGNRRVNCALHMIAVTQARGIGRGQDYITQVQTRGKTRTESAAPAPPPTLQHRLHRPAHRRRPRGPAKLSAHRVGGLT